MTPHFGPTPRRLLAVLAMLSVLLPAWADAPPEFLVGNARATLSIDGSASPWPMPLPRVPLGMLTVVEAEINGVDGFRILVDTGAQTFILFDNDRVRALGLAVTGTFPVTGTGDGEPVVARVARGASLRLGALTLAELWPLILPGAELAIFADRNDTYIDGAIGFDLLARLALTTEARDGEILLVPHGAIEPTGGDTVLTLTHLGRDPYVDVGLTIEPEAEPISVSLHLDTGAALVAELRTDAHPLIASIPTGLGASLAGIQGQARAHHGRVSGLSLGPWTFGPAPVTVSATAGDGPGGLGHGVLGNQLLNRFDTLIDYGAARVILRPVAGSFAPFATGTFGFGAFPRGDAFEVGAIIEGGPAARAGLRRGDRITRWQGQRTSDVATHEIFSTLWFAKPREPLGICLLDIAQTRERCVTLIAVDAVTRQAESSLSNN